MRYAVVRGTNFNSVFLVQCETPYLYEFNEM